MSELTTYWVDKKDLPTFSRDSQLNPCVAVYLASDVDAHLAAQGEELNALKEWKQIILGTGTDQEAVIRLAATEYTKVAVESWRRHVDTLTQQLAAHERQHNDLVLRNRLLRDRPDLPIKRLQAYDDLMKRVKARDETYRINIRVRDERVKELEEALNTIRGLDFTAMQTLVRLPSDNDRVELEGDYQSDARYHYPYRMTVLARFAQQALTKEPA